MLKVAVVTVRLALTACLVAVTWIHTHWSVGACFALIFLALEAEALTTKLHGMILRDLVKEEKQRAALDKAKLAFFRKWDGRSH